MRRKLRTTDSARVEAQKRISQFGHSLTREQRAELLRRIGDVLNGEFTRCWNVRNTLSSRLAYRQTKKAWPILSAVYKDAELYVCSLWVYASYSGELRLEYGRKGDENVYSYEKV